MISSVLRSTLLFTFTTGVAAAQSAPSPEDTLLVEAESFQGYGGWKLDTQFIEIMGSPYLLAHGLGEPVADAETTVAFPGAGTYRVWARTKDWVGPWEAPGAPGRFKVMVDGKVLDKTFGTTSATWAWEDGGTVEVGNPAQVTLALRDVTGFDGRCDALVFSADPGYVPDNSGGTLPAWRRALLGLPEEPEDAGEFDLVVVGGGYAGSCAAISAARMGIKVALVQNRGVLGGNGSSEVRVWAQGNTPAGLYPVGDIVNEFADRASKSPGSYEEFEDGKKEALVRAEDNITLFLHHHVFRVKMAVGEPERVAAVLALDVKTNAVREFRALLFADCTGHGTVGMMADADREMLDEGRMGMSNMWAWENTGSPQPFPDTPWALELSEDDFPYPKRFHAEWFWESGYDKHPLDDLERIRDWNLRAAFGAWDAIKNDGAYADRDPAGLGHANARLTWLAYIGGTRETQQLLGDVILTKEDIVEKRPFADGCVLTTWSIDLHYPKEQYADTYPDNPFIAVAVHGKGVERTTGYPIPYRCFYSRNVDNLFMAGRNISVTHDALGTTRVMKTCGMMGVVVGKAAALCTEHNTNPRGVYQSFLDELVDLMKLPGGARRDSLTDAFDVPPTPAAGADAPSGRGIDPATLPGTVADDAHARVTGSWTVGDGLPGYIADGYRYSMAAPDGKAAVTFEALLPRAGSYEVRLAYRDHENRSPAVRVMVGTAAGTEVVTLDQRKPPRLAHGFVTLGTFSFANDKPATVTLTNEGSAGFACADAVQFLPAPAP